MGDPNQSQRMGSPLVTQDTSRSHSFANKDRKDIVRSDTRERTHACNIIAELCRHPRRKGGAGVLKGKTMGKLSEMESLHEKNHLPDCSQKRRAQLERKNHQGGK